jgi:hypothetical protein
LSWPLLDVLLAPCGPWLICPREGCLDTGIAGFLQTRVPG